MHDDFEPERLDAGDEEHSLEDIEVVVLDPSESVRAGAGSYRVRPSIPRTVGEMAMWLTLRSARIGLSAGRSIYRAAAKSGPGRMISDAVAGALDALGRDGPVAWTTTEARVEEQLGRIIAFIAPVIVQSIDVDELAKDLDVDAFVSAVDINALLDQVDINALLDQVDINALLDQVDIAALLDRVDVNALARRARIGDLVTESTSNVAGSALDVGRRQAVALDTLLASMIDRMLGRQPGSLPKGPPALEDHTEEVS